ncbi:acyltransferase [Krasilnikovia sp. MM14-A1259]|uniref:acyltransferase n=1 Tax=Krasilnikovia sp. MM14-A1259 TaxID=3373539 RepID=UPI00399CB85C
MTVSALSVDVGSAPAAPVAAPPRPRQYALDALRVLAICGVVAIHVVSQYVDNPARGSRSWWIATAIDLGAIWTVPVFVMISGALVLAPAAHRAGPAAFYRKRFARIVPALIAWHVIYLVVVRMLLRGEHLTAKSVTKMLIDGKTYTALYFLWLIAGLYIVAPVLAAFLHAGIEKRAKIMAGVALGWTLVAFMIPELGRTIGLSRPLTLGAWTMWWPYVGYFLAGWALRRTRLGSRGIVVASLLGLAVLIPTIRWYGAGYPHPALRILFPVGYLGATAAVAAICLFIVALSIGARHEPGPRAATVLVRLSDASFGVFLVHLLILAVIRSAAPDLPIGTSLAAALATWAAVVVTSFAISIGAARVPYLRAIF